MHVPPEEALVFAEQPGGTAVILEMSPAEMERFRLSSPLRNANALTPGHQGRYREGFVRHQGAAVAPHVSLVEFWRRTVVGGAGVFAVQKGRSQKQGIDKLPEPRHRHAD